MEINVFIDNVLTNNNLPCTSEDVKRVSNYIYQRARKEAGSSNSIGIDDETVKKWILEYDFSKSEKEQVIDAEEVKQEPKSTYQPIEIKHKKFKEEKSEGTWGKQESLF